MWISKGTWWQRRRSQGEAQRPALAGAQRRGCAESALDGPRVCQGTGQRKNIRWDRASWQPAKGGAPPARRLLRARRPGPGAGVGRLLHPLPGCCEGADLARHVAPSPAVRVLLPLPPPQTLTTIRPLPPPDSGTGAAPGRDLSSGILVPVFASPVTLGVSFHSCWPRVSSSTQGSLRKTS